MAFDAKILEVLVASPGGLDAERQLVRDVVSDWNAVHARERELLLLARGWEIDAGAELSGRPQELINERLLDHADIVVGIFWTRIGSDTGKEVSGTVEEIKRHHSAGRPVMLYFSNKPSPPGYDPDQYRKLLIFKEWALTKGLVGDFSTLEEFRTKLAREIQLVIRDNDYIRELAEVEFVSVFEDGLIDDTALAVSAEASTLAVKASQQDDPLILTMRTFGGLNISVGGEEFGGESARESARWEAAVQELCDRGFSDDINGKRQIFRLNHRGFTYAESLASVKSE